MVLLMMIFLRAWKFILKSEIAIVYPAKDEILLFLNVTFFLRRNSIENYVSGGAPEGLVYFS